MSCYQGSTRPGYLHLEASSRLGSQVGSSETRFEVTAPAQIASPVMQQIISPVSGPQTLEQPKIRSSEKRRGRPRKPSSKPRHDDSQIEFAPIESSSPLPRPEDSQLLTEHQKEVKTRQNQDAQLFAEFSSSPIAQSTALPRTLPKRLDFTSEADAKDDENQGTPIALPDPNGLASDDMPSSPTPSSTKDAGLPWKAPMRGTSER